LLEHLCKQDKHTIVYPATDGLKGFNITARRTTIVSIIIFDTSLKLIGSFRSDSWDNLVYIECFDFRVYIDIVRM
jgi:hypothetical protein